jgi:hypothetical protein
MNNNETKKENGDLPNIRVSRQLIEKIDANPDKLISLGASYTHVKTLKGVIGRSTKRVVMYHAFLENLSGFEDTIYVDIAYLAFNRISGFTEDDKKLQFGVLDLAGNPIKSLLHSPKCKELIVSSTLIEDLTGLQDSQGIEILRCGHSSHLLSLKGCPRGVKIIECSCAPNLVIDKSHLPEGLKELITDNEYSKISS